MEQWFKSRMDEIGVFIKENNLKDGSYVNLYGLLKTIWKDYKRDSKWEK